MEKIYNFKKFSILSAVFGLLISVLSVIIACLVLKFTQTETIGIIGGVGFPTFRFMLYRLYGGLFVFLIWFGISAFIIGLYSLILNKVISRCSTPKLYLAAVGISVVGAMGLVCFAEWYSIVAFHEMSKSTIAYPLSIILGLILFAVFIILIVLYIKQRAKQISVKGIIIDVGLCIVSFMPLFFTFGYLSNVISSIF